MFGGLFTRRAAPKAPPSPPPMTSFADVRRMVEDRPNVMRIELFAVQLVARLIEAQEGRGWYYLPDQIDGLAADLAKELNVAPYRPELVREAVLAVPGCWSAKKRTNSDPEMLGVRLALKARGRDPSRATVYFIPATAGAEHRVRPEPDDGQVQHQPASSVSQATGRSKGGPGPAGAQRAKRTRTIGDVCNTSRRAA